MELKLNTVITGDSAIVLKEFPNDCIDLTVTSPPYDNMRSYKGNSSFDFETIAKELYRVTKQGGVVVWVVGDETINGSETLTSFRQAIFFKDCGFNVETMIWNQGSFADVGSLSKRYCQVFEYMFVLGKGPTKTFNAIKDRKNKWSGTKVHGTLKNKNGEIKHVSNNNLIKEFGQRFNIWDIFQQTQRGYKNHPAPFPESLARDHIISWSNKGNTVLDCFAGSGTTLKVAKVLERNYIGIERELEYIEIINKRLENTIPLFDQIIEENGKNQLSIIE